MLSREIQDALNAQLNAELYSSYLYMSMSAFFESISLGGFASWMYSQAQEEMVHAKKFYDFILRRNGRVHLKQIDAPPEKWESPLAAFADVLTHEEKVTGLINHLKDMAQEAKDHATNTFLDWFVTEQVEEEESVGRVLDQLKLVDKTQGGIFMVDRELASRPRVFQGDSEGVV